MACIYGQSQPTHGDSTYTHNSIFMRQVPRRIVRMHRQYASETGIRIHSNFMRQRKGDVRCIYIHRAWIGRSYIYRQRHIFVCIATSGIHGSKATGVVALRILITDS